MRKFLKFLVPLLLLGIGLSSCNNEDVLINDDREISVKTSSVNEGHFPFLMITFNKRKVGVWPHSQCINSQGAVCIFWIFDILQINPNDYKWPSSLVDQQGSGVYSIPKNYPTPNTLRLRVNYYFTTEDTGLSECRQIANSGLWTISENLVFKSDEIADVIGSDNSIRVNAGNYTITRVDDYQFIVDLPYQIVE